MLNRKGGSLSHNSIIRVGDDLALEYCVEMTCLFRFVLTLLTRKSNQEMAIGDVQTNGTSNVGLTPDNNVMHTKPDLRVFLKWMIADSGSVITDVIWLDNRNVIGNGCR